MSKPQTHGHYSARKRRCIPASDWDGCRLCQSLSSPCSLRHVPGQQSVSPAVLENVTRYERQSKEHGLGVLDSQGLFLELVPLYFHYIHNIAHTIFHEPSFMRRLQDGRVSMIHVYAVCTRCTVIPRSLTLSLFLTSIISTESKDTPPIEYLKYPPMCPREALCDRRDPSLSRVHGLSELGNCTRVSFNRILL